MTTVLIINKDGTIKELKIKTYCEESLFKKVGLKSSVDFKLQHTYQILLGDDTHSVSVFGKTSGKSICVNKYDFPPPIDKTLFYGSCILVKNCIVTNAKYDLNLELWNNMYSELFGGFYDIDLSDDDDESDVDSSSTIDPILLSKEGYFKDDFVVEDSDPSIDGDDLYEDIDEPVKKNVTKLHVKRLKIKNVSKKPINKECQTYLDCASELTAEEYFK
jgi:hypothetical protein